VEWIRKGLVGPSDKYVNFIHVEDLAELCLLALESGQAGETYNVSDGQPHRWKDICAEVSSRWGIVSAKPAMGNAPGKRILNRKLLAHFAYTFQHPNVYDALEALQPPSL
jgi:nucleoside-diphosphate-sugar epimerase